MSSREPAGPEPHEPSGALVQIAQSRALQGAADEVLTSLTPPQRRRWERLHRTQDREDFLAARALAAQLVTCALGPVGPVAFAQTCSTCGGPHGRPQAVDGAGALLPVDVSWAHSDGVVAAAVVDGEGMRVGVDVEHLDPLAIVPGLACTGRSFVRGEAAVKAGVITLDDVLVNEFDWPVGGSGRIGLATVWDLPSEPFGPPAALSVTCIT